MKILLINNIMECQNYTKILKGKMREITNDIRRGDMRWVMRGFNR